METFWRELRTAARTLSRRPAAAVAIVLVLALSIGAATTIFTVVNAALLPSIPWKDVRRIVAVRETNLQAAVADSPISTASFLDWKENNRVFDLTAAFLFRYFNLTGWDAPERVEGLKVDGNFFPLIGARFSLGRNFLPDEEEPGRDQSVVLSDALWRRRFGADPLLVGQTIHIEGLPYTVAGILAPDFWIFKVLNRDVELFVPLALDPRQAMRGSHDLNLLARLAPDVSLETAQARIADAYSQLALQYPAVNSGWSVNLIPYEGSLGASARSTLLLLLAAAGFVLAIACANIATLLLAQGVTREREMAIRAALGASRSCLLRQMLSESVLLALAGGAAGLAIASLAVAALDTLIPYQTVRRVGAFTIDARVLAFACVVSIGAGIVFGVIPALQGFRSNLSESLQELARPALGASGKRVRSLLVILEIALAITMLTPAGLAARSSLYLDTVERNLDAHHVLLAQIWLPKVKYPGPAQISNFTTDVLHRAAALPGVQAASIVDFPPLDIISPSVSLSLDGPGPSDPDQTLSAQYKLIGPGYFQVMRTPLVEGRLFTDQDRAESLRVVITSGAAARAFWPGEDPIGKRIFPRFPPQADLYWIPQSDNAPLTVVGVVSDISQEGLPAPSPMQLYLPYAQNPASFMHLIIRTKSDPARSLAAIRDIVGSIDPEEPLYDIRTMDDVTARSFSQSRMAAALLAAFAALALALATIGVYSVMSYTVNQRTNEIGIRMALGARSADILRTVVGAGAGLVFAGIAAGLPAGYAVSRLMAALLYGVSAVDPPTFLLVPVLLAGVALAATLVPARRAARVDPMAALRRR